MKGALVSMLVPLTLASCASIFNSPTTKIQVYTDRPTTLVVAERTYHVKEKAVIEVKRQPRELLLVATSDSVRKEFVLHPKNSFNWYANVLNYGIGFIWDKGDKRYTYQRNLYIDPYSSGKLEQFAPASRKQMNLVLSLPWVNNFHMKPSGEPSKTNTGFMGISIGLEKYYQSEKFISLRCHAAANIVVPVPAPIDLSGEHEMMTSTYVSVTDNFQLRNGSVGYGLSYSRNTWDFQYHDRFAAPPPTRDPVTKSTHGLGVVLDGYYRLTEHFNIGVIYRPTLLTVRPTSRFTYQHLISLDLAWKLGLVK